MNIFITGATGFVGSHLIQRLSKTQHHLTCLVRESSDVDQIQGGNVTFVYGDINDRGQVLSGMRGSQWVVHLAGVYSFWEPEPSIYYQANVEGTRNVMQCALQSNAGKVVHLSTYGAFGIQTAVPFSEEDPPNPVQSCQYSESKYLADRIVWELHASQGLPVTVLYPANILGPGDDKATSVYIQNILESKFPVRVLENHGFSCVHVKDVAEAIVLSLGSQDCTGEKYLLADCYLTFGEFNRMISDISGVALAKISLPDTLVVWLARVLTLAANILKIPPLYGLSHDQVGAMMSDARCTGEKAERELGLKYTPIRTALREAIAMHMQA